MSKNLDIPFRTADLYLCAYLCVEGFTLVGVVDAKNEPGRKEYVLVDRDDRDELVERWMSYRDPINSARKYAAKLRMVKKALHEALDD